MSSSDTSGAAKTVLAAKLGQFARNYPDVELEVTTDDSRVDLVSAGFDAGIQFGGYIARGYGGCSCVAGSSASDRWCARVFRVTPQAGRAARRAATSMHRLPSPRREQVPWEFDKGGQSMAISVSGSLLVDAWISSFRRLSSKPSVCRPGTSATAEPRALLIKRLPILRYRLEAKPRIRFARTVPTIVPAARQSRASRANDSQRDGFVK